MKRSNPNSRNVQTDIAFIALVILIFVFFVFLIYQPDVLMENFFIAAVVFIVVMISYFTNVTVGLMINAALILAYITFLVVQNLTSGITIKPYVYFWLLMSPALTTAFSMFASSAKSLERQARAFDKKLGQLSTLSEMTRLKNLRAFENDASIYLSISKRYNIDFGILVIKFRHQRELERLSKGSGMKKIVLKVVDVIRETMRTEDELYHLDEYNILFGVLMLTNRESFDKVRGRVKEAIAEIDTRRLLNTRQMILDVRIGAAFSDGEKDALDLLEDAKKDMLYDV